MYVQSCLQCLLLSRDDAQYKMVLLKEKADKDKQQHDAEMKELVRILDHDQNLREFMTRKSRERHEDPQLVTWREKKGNHLFWFWNMDAIYTH